MLCECGCGELAPVSKVNNRHMGYVKGKSASKVAARFGVTKSCIVHVRSGRCWKDVVA